MKRNNLFIILLAFLITSIFVLNVQSVFDSKKHLYEKGKLLDISLERHKKTLYRSTSSYQVTNSRIWGGSNIYPISRSSTIYDISVKVKDIIYVGTYEAKWRWSYDPDWVIGDQIEVRFNEKRTKMYLKKHSGGELKANVVKKIRQ